MINKQKIRNLNNKMLIRNNKLTNNKSKAIKNYQIKKKQ